MIALFRHQTIGLADPIITVFDHVMIACKVIVIIANLYKSRRINAHTIIHQVCITVCMRINAINVLEPYTVFVKEICANLSAVHADHAGIVEPSGKVCISVRIVIIAVEFDPSVAYPIHCPSVSRALFICDKITARKHLIHEQEMERRNRLFAIYRFKRFFIKIIIVVAAVFRDHAPSALELAFIRIIGIAVILKEPCHFADTVTVIIKSVPIFVFRVFMSRNLVYTRNRLIVYKIVQGLPCAPPAFSGLAIEVKLIFEAGIGRIEVSAFRVRRILRLFIRIYAILLLEVCLAGHAVKRICAEIYVIADRAFIDYCKQAVFPLGILFCNSLNTTEYTNRIRSRRINCLRLFYPVANNGNVICCLVKCAACQPKIIIGDFYIRNIDFQRRINIQLYLDHCFAADALCQLEQKIPSCNIADISAGNHFQERQQRIRELNFLHVECKDI